MTQSSSGNVPTSPDVVMLTGRRFLDELKRDATRVERAISAWKYDIILFGGDEFGALGGPSASAAILRDIVGSSSESGAVNRELATNWLGLLARLPSTGLPRARYRWWSRVVLVDGDGARTSPVQIPPPRVRRVSPVGMDLSLRVSGVAGFAIVPGIGMGYGVVQLHNWFPGLPYNPLVPILILMAWLVGGQYYAARQDNKGREVRKAAPIPAISASTPLSAAEPPHPPAPKEPPTPPLSEEPPVTATRLWKQSLRRHNAVREQFVVYETDPTQYFFRPLLADRQHPAVQAFYEALAAADALRIDDDHIPTDLDYVRDYADRVAAADNAWNTADKLARTVGDDHFTTEQRKTMRTAQRLVNLVLDDAASINERTSAYNRVLTLFKSANLAPATSITSTLQRQLTDQQRRQLPEMARPTAHGSAL